MEEYVKINDDVTEVEVPQRPSAPKLDTTGMSHLDKIKLACSATGVTFSEPKGSCKKCNGKGYIGVKPIMGTTEESPNVETRIDSKPIPCPCVFRDNTKEYKDQMKQQADLQFKLNRKQRRRQEKMVAKYKKSMGIK